MASAWRGSKTIAVFAVFGPLVAWLMGSLLLALATGLDPEKLDPQRLLGVGGVFGFLLMISYLVGVIPGLLAVLAFFALRGAGSTVRFGVCMFIAATSAGLGLSLFVTDKLIAFVWGCLAAGAAAGLIGWVETALGRGSA